MSAAPDVPQAHDAEQSLLGACLLSPIAIEQAAELIGPEDFQTLEHKLLFQAIIDCWNNGMVDAVVVKAHLGDKVETEYLLKLQYSTPAISNAGKYARMVADAALRRRLLGAAGEISQLAYGQLPAFDAADAADKARELLADLDMPQGQGPPDRDIDSFIASVDTSYDWLVENFLEYRDRMLVTAAEGAGKSTLLAQIAVCVAAGLHPWTFEEVPPRNVLVVDCENSERLVTRRFGTLRAKAKHLDPQRLRIHCRPEGLDLTTRTDRRWLIDRVNANRAELLVIGPAYRLSAGVAERGDIGGEDHARKVTKALDDVRNRCNVALLMETHAPHGSSGYGRDLRPFGSSVWLRWPEFGIGLRRDGDDGFNFSVEHWRGPRDVRTWPTTLSKGGSWLWNPIMPTKGALNVAALGAPAKGLKP